MSIAYPKPSAKRKPTSLLKRLDCGLWPVPKDQAADTAGLYKKADCNFALRWGRVFINFSLIMAENFFLTTAIDYTNAAPHIGHAYEKVLADVIARYQRLKAAPTSTSRVHFLTGVDQHGQKVQQSSEKQGIAPELFVEGLTQKFIALWEKLEIRYDRWAATTDPVHKSCVQAILQRLFEEGQLYKAKHGGYYSVRQEQFLTDKERNAEGEFGPEWGEVVFIEEENYYFKLAEHRDWLLNFIDSHPDFVTPAFRQVELRNAVEKLAGDLCVSRPKSRLAWGIEFPFDPDFVTYVWFDALVNYISFAGFDPRPGADQSEFKALWPALHVIGKDILVPAHGVYWPIMLHSLGFSDEQMPTLLVHGWWNIAGAKISKSLGNSIDPNELADRYGAESLRYYLMSDIVTGKDADFSEERVLLRHNTELANALGNLLNRALNMAARYRTGTLKKINATDLPSDEATDLLRKLAEKDIPEAIATYTDAMDRFRIDSGLSQALGIALACNGLVEATAPWKLAKDETQSAKLDAVLYHLAESLRIIAILISPVMPRSAQGIFDQLNWSAAFTLQDTTWGGLPDGHTLGTPTPLFPRLEAPKA